MADNKENMVLVSLPEDVIKELKWLAEQTGVSPLNALKQAISTESYVLDETRKHGYVLIKNKKASYQANSRNTEESNQVDEYSFAGC